MRTPYKYLIGITAGVLAGFFIPVNDSVLQLFAAVTEIVQRVGRYLIIPLIFFSLPVAVTRLRRMKKLGFLFSRNALYILVSTAALTLLGTIIGWIFNSVRIPVITDVSPEGAVENFADILRMLIPYNGFGGIITNTSFLLPVVVPAFLLGWHFHFDREIAEPAFNFFDSMSRIIFRINHYYLYIMPILLGLLAMNTVINAKGVVDFNRFIIFLSILVGSTIVLIFGVFPLAYWFFSGKKSPWKPLSSLFTALLATFVSSSPLFSYGKTTLSLYEKESIPRHNAAVSLPFNIMFARGGTAFVTAITMLTVIRSYSSLEITFYQAAWTALFSFLISFAIPSKPVKGLVGSLILIGALYGRGLDDGWLIVTPVIPLMMMIAVLLDAVTSAFIILLMNYKGQLSEE